MPDSPQNAAVVTRPHPPEAGVSRCWRPFAGARASHTPNIGPRRSPSSHTRTSHNSPAESGGRDARPGMSGLRSRPGGSREGPQKSTIQDNRPGSRAIRKPSAYLSCGTPSLAGPKGGIHLSRIRSRQPPRQGRPRNSDRCSDSTTMGL